MPGKRFATGIFFAGLSPSGGDSSAPPFCDTTEDPSWDSFLDPTIDNTIEIELDNGPVEFEVTDARYRSLSEPGKWEIVLSTVMANMQQPGTAELDQGYWLYGPLEVSRFAFEETSCFFSRTDSVGPGQSSAAQTGFTVDMEPTGLVKLIVEYDDNRGLITVASN